MDKISNLKLNLLTEEVYLIGHVNKLYENILKEELDKPSEDNGSLVKKVAKDLGLSSSFIFKFGTGIGAFMRPVTELLQNKGVNINEQEVILLIITAVFISIESMKNSGDVNKLRKALKEKGLLDYLKDVNKLLHSSKEVLKSVGKTLGKTLSSLTDILGFTFMLVPTMNIINKLIVDNGITPESVMGFLSGLALAVGSYGLKNVIDKINKKRG